jgi:S-adenosylmethionine:tRNA ribosyltransferase-isomerase
LLLIDVARGTFGDARPSDLARLLSPGDLLVVNDAATLPASLTGRTESGEPVEVRLLIELDAASFRAVLLGAGDWRTRTEHRPPPERLRVGARIDLGDGFHCTVENVDPLSDRLVEVRFDRQGAALYLALYLHGRPVQYAHVPDRLELWSVQTGYAARPWAVEMPSAGRPLTFELILELRRRGIAIAALTHAAGLSATGEPAIDAALPLRERYDVPPTTVAAIDSARDRGGRVVAVGTSVVRALESSLTPDGRPVAGSGTTDLVVRAGHHLRVVDALLTGMHERDASHFQLLQAFAPRELLERAYAHADESGYLGHEFGDATLIIGRAA